MMNSQRLAVAWLAVIVAAQSVTHTSAARAPSAAALQDPPAAVGFTVSSDVVAPGTPVTAAISGTPGHFYALVGSSMGAGLSYAGRSLAVGSDFAILAMGTLDGTGQIAVTITPPFLLTTLDRYYVQAATSPSSSFIPIDLRRAVCCATVIW